MHGCEVKSSVNYPGNLASSETKLELMGIVVRFQLKDNKQKMRADIQKDKQYRMKHKTVLTYVFLCSGMSVSQNYLSSVIFVMMLKGPYFAAHNIGLESE